LWRRREMGRDEIGSVEVGQIEMVMIGCCRQEIGRLGIGFSRRQRKRRIEWE